MDKETLGLRSLDQTNKGRTVLIYGEAGNGKTTLLNTLKGDILLFNSDCGEQVLYDSEDRKFDVFSMVDKTMVDPVEQIDRFEKLSGRLLVESELPWDYIAFDNVTELQDLYLLALMKKRNVKYPRQIDYRDTGVEMQRHLKNLRNFTYKNTNVIYIAWEDVNKIEDSGGEIQSDRQPMIMGKSCRKIMGLVDFCMALRVDKKGERFLQLDGDQKYLAKKREEQGREYPSYIRCPKGKPDTLQKFFEMVS